VRLTIESTDLVVQLDGVPARLWRGVTEAGEVLDVYVHRLAFAADDPAAAAAAAAGLEETAPPAVADVSRDNVASFARELLARDGARLGLSPAEIDAGLVRLSDLLARAGVVPAMGPRECAAALAAELTRALGDRRTVPVSCLCCQRCTAPPCTTAVAGEGCAMECDCTRDDL
jgi:hypothetical protein